MTLRLRLLGVPTWCGPSGDSTPLSRKDAALLGMLALDGAHARDVLAGRLWPQVSETRAAASLRQRIARLRRDTGHRVVHTGHSVLLADAINVDAAVVGTMSEGALLQLGDFLAGFDYAENELIDAWVASRREMLKRARADALSGHAYRHEAAGELAAALRLCESILSLLPLREHAWRHQMRLHYLRGDRSSAIQTFERFEALLRSETGARPSGETVELLALIEAAHPAQRQGPCVLPAGLLRPSRLVGRDGEWRALDRAWASAKSFLLLAEAGMGKTRLLTDFVHGRPGVLLLRVRPGERRAPYSLLARTMHRARTAFAPAQGCGAAEGTLESDDVVEQAACASLPRHEILRVAEQLLARAQMAGLAELVVDDLHLADLESVEALRWLSGSSGLATLRFGFASQPSADAAMHALLHNWANDVSRLEPVTLSPLSADGIAVLVGCLGLQQFSTPGISERLYRHAGGHPLFTLETLKDVFFSGQSNGSPACLPTPATVRTLLDRRFDALSAPARELVYVAVVAGADLTVQRAANLLERRPVELVMAWTELEACQILRGNRFAHELVRNCAALRLPYPVQQALHARLAAVLADDRDVLPSRVAEHYEAAGRLSAAAAWRRAASALASQRIAAKPEAVRL
jgi:DNA-binding SARP family transcriptional activator